MSLTSIRYKRASQGGFTLLEVMITVAIIALGFALATPAYLIWVAKADLKKGVTEVYGGLQLAKVAAMSRNRTITVSLTNMLGRVQWSADNGVFPPTQLGNRVTNVTVANVIFTSMGLRQSGVAGTDQLITFSNTEGLVYSIAITPGGKVNWCATPTCP